MEALTSVLSAFLENQTSRRNLIALLRLVFILVLIVITFSVLFHVIMEHEGQHHSWTTGFYWTLTVMSTLGFGDITFESDLGRAFSIVVLVTGVTHILSLEKMMGNALARRVVGGDSKAHMSLASWRISSLQSLLRLALT